jgi:hypothetical protein
MLEPSLRREQINRSIFTLGKFLEKEGLTSDQGFSRLSRANNPYLLSPVRIRIPEFTSQRVFLLFQKIYTFPDCIDNTKEMSEHLLRRRPRTGKAGEWEAPGSPELKMRYQTRMDGRLDQTVKDALAHAVLRMRILQN